eukprot:CAMPEP_0195068698 /NCGR_PEP_ID=MMETSP0448-20130528/13301_1 /TAXON_ID=66468 /ORGANISM="Heterocapsa triquestra, Strain CCMP 448" /LENGTH=74 /DNA_ID=CAMNT_0040100239 /DNA_START=83 /DNA_END=307 /DNA_ORIENTATION=+
MAVTITVILAGAYTARLAQALVSQVLCRARPDEIIPPAPEPEKRRKTITKTTRLPGPASSNENLRRSRMTFQVW